VKVHSVRVADWLWVARNGHCHFGENQPDLRLREMDLSGDA
jgi:hypothetical protein